MPTKTLIQNSPPRAQRERELRQSISRDARPSFPRATPGTASAQWAPRDAARGAASDELLIHTDAVSICLLVNRRHGHLRVIDFRAGPTVAKRNTVLAAAKREGIEKVFTLVERDEVATWMRLGFSREGSIPGFYRRSDAWIMGIVVPLARPLSPAGLAALDDDEDEIPMEPPVSPVVLLADRTVVRAKKLLRDEPASLPSVRLAPASEADAAKAVAAAQKKGVLLTGLERFGRDTTRVTYACSARGATLHISAEAQPFFHNTFLELLVSPKTEAERLAATAAVAAIVDHLRETGTTNAFSVTPADDVMLAFVMIANGFRRSAALASHLAIGGDRKDAVVWSKKLVQMD